MSTQPAPMDNSANGLAGVVNLPTTVHAFGKSYDIKQLSIGQAFAASAHIARVTLVFGAVPEIQQLQTFGERLSGVLQVISSSEESVVGLLSVVTGESEDFIKQQNSMEALEVFAVVIEKNLPLFSPENLTRIKTRFAGLLERISALGGVTSTTSLEPDTTSKPS